MTSQNYIDSDIIDLDDEDNNYNDTGSEGGYIEDDFIDFDDEDEDNYCD